MTGAVPKRAGEAARASGPVLLHITTIPMSLTFLVGQLGYMKQRGFQVHALSSPGPDLVAFGRTERIPVSGVAMRRRITPGHDLGAVAAILRVLREKTIDEQMQWLREHGVTHLFYPRAYVEESSAYRAYGFVEDLDAWRRDSEHFQRIKVITLPRVRGGGLETVEIYRVRYEKRNSSGGSTHVRS